MANETVKETENQQAPTKAPPGATISGGPNPAPPPNAAETLSGKPLEDLSEREQEIPDQEGAVASAAAGDSLSPAGQSEALKWFLKATPDRAEAETKTLKLNFGTSNEPEWVEWVIRPVSLDKMRSIRQAAANSRYAKQTGGVDEYRVNLEIVVAGTKDPDLTEAAKMLYEAKAITSNDPATALRIRFQGKPGYIAQVSGEIMSLSGFNDDDVTEKDAVDAAGNS